MPSDLRAPGTASMTLPRAGSAPWQFLYFFPLPQGHVWLGAAAGTAGTRSRRIATISIRAAEIGSRNTAVYFAPSAQPSVTPHQIRRDRLEAWRYFQRA